MSERKTTKSPRKPETWGETYNRCIAKGWDHGAAAYQADLNQQAQDRRAERAARAEGGAAQPLHPEEKTDLGELDLDGLRHVAREALPTWAKASWEVREVGGIFEVRTEQDGDVDGDTGRHTVVGGELVALLPDALGDADLAEFIATFDPPTVLALVSQARLLEEARATIRKQADEIRSLKETAYGED